MPEAPQQAPNIRPANTTCKQHNHGMLQKSYPKKHRMPPCPETTISRIGSSIGHALYTSGNHRHGSGLSGNHEGIVTCDFSHLGLNVSKLSGQSKGHGHHQNSCRVPRTLARSSLSDPRPCQGSGRVVTHQPCRRRSPSISSSFALSALAMCLARASWIFSMSVTASVGFSRTSMAPSRVA